MSSEIAIKVENVGKCYHIYYAPYDRLRQFILPHVQRMFFQKPRKYYRDFWGLRDVSFAVNRGETVGIVGCNGSGKSTLLQIICGTLSQTSGNVIYNGRVAALLELGAGFNPEFTGRENVYMNASVLGLTKDEVDARFDQIAAFADIGEFIEQPVKAYSSGMYVRLAFSVAIHVEPDILVVDEALAVGDIRFQLKCQRKFEELRSEGVTILLVSHSGSDVVRLCTQAVWLDKGRVRQIGEPKKVIEAYSAWMLHDTSVVVSSAINSDISIESNSIEDRLIPVHESAFITGDNGAEVVSVGMFSENGKLLTVIGHAQPIKVVVKLLTKTRIEQPYFAFQIVSEKGLRVLGSNNHVLGIFYEPIEAGTVVVVSFSYNFPELHNGNYLLAVGVADGTPELHIRHQYVADAYEFRVLSTSLMQKQDVLLKIPDCDLSIETRSN